MRHNHSLEAMGNYQDKDISDKEDEGEQDIDIDDKSIETNMVDNEDKTHYSALNSNPVLSTKNFKSYLNLPDIPFNLLMEMLSTTDLRRLTQVSYSWKKRITENFLSNPANLKTLRARATVTARGWSRREMGIWTRWIPPSNEEINNFIWLSK